MTEATSDRTATEAVPAPGRPKVLVLGGGELSRELVLAFQRLGALVIVVDRYADAPAQAVADHSVVVKMTEAEALTALIDRECPHYVVAESSAVAADALIGVAERDGVEVVPTPRATRLSLDREGLRRLAADELGLPTAPFWFAGSAEELAAVARHAGFPLVVKPVAGAPGDGRSVLRRPEDVEPAWRRAVAAGRITHNRVMVEAMIDVDIELTLLTVRSTGPSGPVLDFCEPIGHRRGERDVLEAWQPQHLTPDALEVAKSIAARIVNSLGGRGVFGVELWVRRDRGAGEEVLFADVRARPYDGGLVTLRSQRLSQFELHARAIMGLPVDTILVSPAAAGVAYGGAAAETGAWTGGEAALREALAVPESDVRIFGRPDDEAHTRRRLGVALATAPDVTEARDRVRRIGTALDGYWCR